MVVLLDLCFPSPHLAASMVIDRPEAIDGAPRRGWTAKEELSCLARGMAAQPAGEESCDAAVAPKAVEASAVLRPDPSIEEAVGALDPNRADIKENVAIWEPTERAGPTNPMLLSPL
jgi:hypothetical protein